MFSASKTIDPSLGQETETDYRFKEDWGDTHAALRTVSLPQKRLSISSVLS